jgi:mannose-1-phosphate guanylyltransferase/mannose-1-phosphate guanylyltransferase/mannose-6-phosphate isomerase
MKSAASIHPVILCGGSGTRLWPVSRKARPKPFLPLVGDTTLFQQALGRVGHDDHFAPPMVVAGTQHVELIREQMADVADARLVVEPMGRNTAPAIALAAALLPPDDIMLVCPSDHYIADETAFRSAALAAAQLAREDWLVSFGIAPDRPETGYGYLHRGEAMPGGYRIARFVEKPDLEHARAYLESGEFSWNGGIFAFRAGALLDELERHRPEMAQLVGQAATQGTWDGVQFHPAPAPFAAIAGESIDYAVMENTTRAAMVPADMGWSDIGNWAALQDALPADALGNAARGAADLVDCTRVLAITDGPRISAIGLKDVIITVSGDEVLVTTREGAQMVGQLPGASNQ